MSPRDFSVQAYATDDGGLRVYRVGVLWYADVRDERGTWCSVVEHALTDEACMVRCLDALGILDEEDEPDLGPDDLGW